MLFLSPAKFCQTPKLSMWALKRGFVREVGGLGLVRNDLNSFILYSIDRIDYYFLLIKCVIETSIENFFLSAFHASCMLAICYELFQLPWSNLTGGFHLTIHAMNLSYTTQTIKCVHTHPYGNTHVNSTRMNIFKD